MALIKPQVYAGMVTERMENVTKVAALAKNVGDLKNNVGETIVFPVFKRGSKPKTLARGGKITPEELDQVSSTATIKMIATGRKVYDIDDMVALGDRIDESAKQLGEGFAEALDTDLVAECLKSELVHTVADSRALTFADMNAAFSLHEDRQELADFAGIVIHSLAYPALLEMPGFVDGTMTHTTEGNGLLANNGFVGMFRGVPVYLANNGLLDTAGNPITLILKKDAVGYMPKREIKIEEERVAAEQLTNIYGTYVYAVKLLDAEGVVQIKQTVA